MTSATSYMTEHGLLCWPCFSRMQNQQEAVAREVGAIADSWARRATLNMQTHAVIWVVSIILAAKWVPLPGWLTGALMVATIVLMIGLARISRWAFWTALSIDIAGALALIALGAVTAASRSDSGSLWLLMMVASFPLALAGFVWALRRVYLRKPPDPSPEAGVLRG